jgi:hypothetical protein
MDAGGSFALIRGNTDANCQPLSRSDRRKLGRLGVLQDKGDAHALTQPAKL